MFVESYISSLYGVKPAKPGPVTRFNNMAEQVQAQSDPRYCRDASYTLEVDARIEATVQWEQAAHQKAEAAVARAAGRVQPFTNEQEVTKAFSDPRYGRDEEYTQEVHIKVQAAEFLHVEERQPQQAPASLGEPRGAEGGAVPFKSPTERVKAYADDRYQTDPDYRDEVTARDAVTPDFSESLEG